MHLSSMARRQAILAGVKRLERRVLAGVGAGKGARVAMGVRVCMRMRVGVMPLQCQSLGWTTRVVVPVATAMVVVSAWAVTVVRRTVAGASSATTRGMLRHATADMVPFHRRRGVVGRPGRKGSLWA